MMCLELNSLLMSQCPAEIIEVFFLPGSLCLSQEYYFGLLVLADSYYARHRIIELIQGTDRYIKITYYSFFRTIPRNRVKAMSATWATTYDSSNR